MYKIEKKKHTVDFAEYTAKFRDAERVLGYCAKCPKYNTFWTCPSYDHDIFNPIKFLGKFTRATIFGHKLTINKELIDTTKEKDAQTEIYMKIYAQFRKSCDEELLKLESDCDDSRVLYAGCCTICPKCSKVNQEPCAYPDRARYSLESLGFDVAKTTIELFETELKWGNDGKLPEYLFFVSAILHVR